MKSYLQETNRELLRYLGDNDPTTNHTIKAILAVEEEHADELADLLAGLQGELR